MSHSAAQACAFAFQLFQQVYWRHEAGRSIELNESSQLRNAVNLGSGPTARAKSANQIGSNTFTEGEQNGAACQIILFTDLFSGFPSKDLLLTHHIMMLLRIRRWSSLLLTIAVGASAFADPNGRPPGRPIGPGNPPPFIKLNRLPEFDAKIFVETKLVQDATLDQLHAATEGSAWRIIRFQRLMNGRFQGVLIRNTGVFKDQPSTRLIDGLDDNDIARYNSDPRLRATALPIGVACYRSGGSNRYTLLLRSNNTNGAPPLDYQILKEVGFPAVSAFVKTHRVLDIDGYFVNKNSASFCAVGIKKAGDEDRLSAVMKTSSLDAIREFTYPANFYFGKEVDQLRYRLLTIKRMPADLGHEYLVLGEVPPIGERFTSQFGFALTDKNPAQQPAHFMKRYGGRLIAFSSFDSPGGIKNLLTYLETTEMLTSGNNSLQSQFDPLEKIIKSILRSNEIPGASVAIVKSGRLVYARGFGYSDLEQNRAMQPTTPLRLASVSKPITALAILHGIETGKLGAMDLGDRPMAKLKPAQPGYGADSQHISLRDMLEHRSGMKCAFSWHGTAQDIKNTCADKDQTCCANFTDCSTGKPVCECANKCSVLAPGEKPGGDFYLYMNSHYMAAADYLGNFLPKQSPGFISPFHQFAATNLLAPLKIGRIFPGGKAPAGVVQGKNYASLGFKTSSYDTAPWAEDSPVRLGSTSWAGSAVDLVRLFCSADGSCPGPRILGPSGWVAMRQRPGSVPQTQNAFYAKGFNVVADPADPNGAPISLEHNGYLPGSTFTMLRLEKTGVILAILLNSDHPTWRAGKLQGAIGLIRNEISTFMKNKSFPTSVNEFSKYGL